MERLGWVLMTKSQKYKNEKDKIYDWINHLQQHPDDEEIQEKMVQKYENLVQSLAHKYSKHNDLHEDLVQVGMIGLLGAIKRFDPSYGISFESFAIPTILGEIKRYIRDQTWSVYVPRRIKELGPRIKKAIEELTNENQEPPTIPEIAAHVGASEEEVLETMEMSKSYRALSVDRTIEADSDGSTVTILDLLGEQEQDYHQVDIKMLLEKILPSLSEREQTIIRCTFFENMSQKETGELLGISQMHVSRLQRRSLRKLREVMPFNNMEGFD